MINRYLCTIILIICCTLNIPAFAEPENQTQNNTVSSVQDENSAPEEDTSPAPHAQAAILADLKSGKILYSKNPDQKVYPASTTKILTGIIALENANLTDVVTASSEAISPITLNHSHMGILVGEELTVEQLLYGMLVYSANDAANVLAVHIAGSLDAFAQMMNEKAAELGAKSSNFVNAHGFHDDNHYTTANDLLVIARHAMQNEKFREIVKTDMYIIPPTSKYKETRYLSSTNHLISRRRYANYFYKKSIGIKTGYTDEAGSCLVSAAVDGDTELLSVVMNCKNTTMIENGAYSFTDSKNLLEYGFENFKYATVAAVGDIVSDSKVYEAKDNIRVALTVLDSIGNILPSDYSKNDITASIALYEKPISEEDYLQGDYKPRNEDENNIVHAPISKGDIIGTISYKYKGEEIGTSKLVATNDVKKDYVTAAIHLIVKIITNPIFLILFILLVVLRTRAVIIKNKRRKKRRNRLQHFNGSYQEYDRKK